MQILAALDRPTEGTFVLEGYDITRLPDAELARIGDQHFGPELTTLENVELPLVYAGIPAKARRGQAKAYLEAVGLEDGRVVSGDWVTDRTVLEVA